MLEESVATKKQEEEEMSGWALSRAFQVARRNFARGGKQVLLPILTIATGSILIFTTQVFTRYLRDQAQTIANLFGASANSQSILSSTFWISTTVLVIGALEAIIVMSRNVIRRTREIGIMKTVGIRSSIISWIILIETLFYGVIGGAVGVLGGLVVLLLIGASQLSLDPILVLIPLVPVASAYAFSLGVLSSVLAGLYPSFRAIKLSVLEAISYEA